MKALTVTPKSLITTQTTLSCCDPYDVFTPEEISRHWTLVKFSPIVQVGERAYCGKIWALRSYQESNNHVDPPPVTSKFQEDVIRDINRIGLTHITWIKYAPPIIMPDWKVRWKACVQGFVVRT
jgi:hypothetical protein